MRLLDSAEPQPRASLVCPYHGWTYKLDGALRHMPHAAAFGACAEGRRALRQLPCAERHGLIWVLPDAHGDLDLDVYLGTLNDELPWFGMESLVVFRKVEAEYPANWKLIVDAFLESYHIRVLHRDTIYPFFSDGNVASERIGPHIHSLVARRTASKPFPDPQIARGIAPAGHAQPAALSQYHHHLSPRLPQPCFSLSRRSRAPALDPSHADSA